MIEEKIQKGIDFLDRNIPTWRDRFNNEIIEDMDMWNTDRCVLAIASGMNYGHAIKAYNLSSVDAYTMGFLIPIDSFPPLFQAYNTEWNAALREEIK